MNALPDPGVDAPEDLTKPSTVTGTVDAPEFLLVPSGHAFHNDVGERQAKTAESVVGNGHRSVGSRV